MWYVVPWMVILKKDVLLSREIVENGHFEVNLRKPNFVNQQHFKLDNRGSLPGASVGVLEDEDRSQARLFSLSLFRIFKAM